MGQITKFLFNPLRLVHYLSVCSKVRTKLLIILTQERIVSWSHTGSARRNEGPGTSSSCGLRLLLSGSWYLPRPYRAHE